MAFVVKNTKYGRKSESRPLNAFGRWCIAHDFDGDDVAERLEVSRGHAWAYMLPLDHARFSMPRDPVMRRIFLWTEGAIGPERFYDVEAWRKELADPKQAAA